MIAEMMESWISALESNMNLGVIEIHNGENWNPATWPAQVSGWGSTEAPRGSLGHWVQVANQKILRYQMVVPTTWNGSPRDAQGLRGPFEQSLIGTPISDPSRPLEILRIIHSFDPCMACSVHLFDAQGNKTGIQVTTYSSG
jgi:Ni,Fe-hydrogenase I large subunit